MAKKSVKKASKKAKKKAAKKAQKMELRKKRGTLLLILTLYLLDQEHPSKKSAKKTKKGKK